MATGLSVRDLAIGYDDWQIGGINLDVATGEVVALVGPSGCGKSTLLQAILGAGSTLAGTISVDGSNVSDRPIEERGIGIVFQRPMLFPHLSVGRNVSYGLERAGVSRADSRAQGEQLLEWVGLPGFSDRTVETLSGGQSQRVALARAMAVKPRVLLLDEPFSALDEDLRERLAIETLSALRAADVAVIYVTHSRAEAQAVADRVIDFESLTRSDD